MPMIFYDESIAPTIRYDGRINTSPSTPGAYEELALDVTTILEPLLFKNMTERVGDVQDNLLYVWKSGLKSLKARWSERWTRNSGS